MTNSILITGADKTARKELALKRVNAFSSEFDTHIINTEEEKGIAAVKEIIKKTAQKPFNSSLSSIIILEADGLTQEAQNALLKTLEEPPEMSQIILTAPNKTTLLPTVVSRCLEISLKNEKESKKTKVMNFTSLSKKLETFEKESLDDLLANFEDEMKGKLKATNEELAKFHRFEKLLLKMKTAEKANLNKKLIALILALETPN